MKTKLLTIIFFIISTITFSQTTSIPDADFENYLEANGMGNGIANDNLVTTANINTVTFLDVSSVGTISDLTGIEAFTALDYLICEGNQLTTLNLSQNTVLTALFANANQLTSLNIQNGNNSNVTNFMTGNNPNLNCIQVDDVAYSTTNWTSIDAHTSFSTACSAISGIVSYNCTTPVAQQNVQIKATASNSGNIYYTTTNSLGEYTFNINETGAIIIETAAPNLISTPTNYNVTYAGQSISAQNFCVDNTTTGDDVHVTLVPLTPAPRPGFASLYRIYYGNYGSTTQSGDIKFSYDASKVASVSSPDTFTQIGSELTWVYTNLAPFEIRYIDVLLNINPATGTNAVAAGDYLLNTVLITPITGDIFQQDNSDETYEEVVNGYDPNDVTIFEGPYIQPSQSSDFLNFRIRFQNTGTASAINIDVKTTLDANLDLSTFTLLGSSHTMNTSIINQNEVTFSFPAINLDYESNNEPASHGWVTFKIKPIAGFAIGDLISSQASIFFDTNAPIITNTATVQIAPSGLTYVPDNNFENFLETHDANGNIVSLGDPTSMGNGVANDDYVTTARINMVTELDIEDQEISDLIGIEDFTLLENLYCHTNSISSLDISSNINLISLICSNNALTSLDVSQNPNLVSLHIGHNQISSLTINNSNLLTDLFIPNNLFTHFDASGFPNLIEFRCENNQLTSLNIKNGNNINLPYFDSRDNPNLTCIEVDDAAWSTANWTSKDATSIFVNNQAECTALSTDEYNELEFSLSPNPVNGKVNINVLEKAALIIYTLTGKEINKRELKVGENEINNLNLVQGIYLFKIITNDKTATKKVIIN